MKDFLRWAAEDSIDANLEILTENKRLWKWLKILYNKIQTQSQAFKTMQENGKKQARPYTIKAKVV